MTNVDSDDHHFVDFDEFWKLDSDGLSASFGVDLLHDIGGVGKIHFSSCRHGDHLGHDVIFCVADLEFWIVLRVAQDVDGKRLSRRSIAGSRVLHLVVEFLTTKSLLYCGFDGLCIWSSI